MDTLFVQRSIAPNKNLTQNFLTGQFDAQFKYKYPKEQNVSEIKHSHWSKVARKT